LIAAGEREDEVGFGQALLCGPRQLQASGKFGIEREIQARFLHGGIKREDQKLAAPVDRRDLRAGHRLFQALLRERAHDDGAAPSDRLHTLDGLPRHAALQDLFHHFEFGKFGHAGSIPLAESEDAYHQNTLR
jgi:hypothetical protein